ncbi:hypothetical protein BTH41_01610 [Bacillus mycoides]|nr:hypothetical protein BTH41_01610 [Bacillus mycoides]
MKQVYQVNTEQLGFHERLQRDLSGYPMKTIEKDDSVIIHHVKDPYFLVKDIWNVDFLENIPQFQEMVEKYKGTNRNVRFQINNATVNLEIKYVWYQKLFKDEWSLSTVFGEPARLLRRLTVFLNEKYPNLFSLLDLDIDQTEREWWFWLEQQGISTQYKRKDVTGGVYIHKAPIASFLRFIHSNFLVLTDTREEWEKDRWDVRMLHDKYGINYNKTKPDYYLDFTKIEQVEMRQHIKRYFKQRLLSKNHFSWGSAQGYLTHLSRFWSLIFSLEPSWTNLKGLKRSHMERYIQWLHEYTRSNLTQKNAHPESHIQLALTYIGKFLRDTQRYEYDIAPDTRIQLLLFPEDKPKLKKKSIDQIDYIPDYVLEQLFMHIDDLHKEVVPVVWVAYKTGLRISDVLGLTSNCLERINGKYSIVTDIEKTYVQGHRIPIDEELANILAILIHKSKENSNQGNNPEGFIFVRYRGSRKGNPYFQKWIQRELNKLAKQYGREDIVEKGSRNLKRYEEILSKLQEGNVIFGRMERMKRKQGVENG